VALPQVTTADLDITVGQLSASQFPLGDQLKPGPLQVYASRQFSGVTAPSMKRQKTLRGTRTTPSYSPMPTPNSTARRSVFYRASSGKLKNMAQLARLSVPVLFVTEDAPIATRCRVPAFVVAGGVGFRDHRIFRSSAKADWRLCMSPKRLRCRLSLGPFHNRPGACAH
jgi:hypothetical protein